MDPKIQAVGDEILAQYVRDKRKEQCSFGLDLRIGEPQIAIGLHWEVQWVNLRTAAGGERCVACSVNTWRVQRARDKRD